jgi:hypothetical protein
VPKLHHMLCHSFFFDFICRAMLRIKLKTRRFWDKIDPAIKQKGTDLLTSAQIVFKFYFKDWAVDKVQIMHDAKFVFVFISSNQSNLLLK